MNGEHNYRDGEFPVWKEYRFPHCDHMPGNVGMATTFSSKGTQPWGVEVGRVTYGSDTTPGTLANPNSKLI